LFVDPYIAELMRIEVAQLPPRSPSHQPKCDQSERHHAGSPPVETRRFLMISHRLRLPICWPKCFGEGRTMKAGMSYNNGGQIEERTMASNAAFAEVATLAGDPGRAGMLHALMDGRALTATELARVAGVTPQTASGHLSRLTAGGLVAVEKQGRHRYHRLASPAVARMLESIMQVAADTVPPRRKIFVGPRDQALRTARTCYDHLAGHLGVALADALVANGQIELASDAGLVTDRGAVLFNRLGIDLTGESQAKGRLMCRPCLDWSERRPHLAGVVGTALCKHCFSAGWIKHAEGTRAVTITAKGQRNFRDVFGIGAA
jgi:DNA-binding transcriptional ArsR family regulator